MKLKSVSTLFLAALAVVFVTETASAHQFRSSQRRAEAQAQAEAEAEQARLAAEYAQTEAYLKTQDLNGDDRGVRKTINPEVSTRFMDGTINAGRHNIPCNREAIKNGVKNGCIDHFGIEWRRKF